MSKTRADGLKTAIRLLQEEIRRHYGCRADPCAGAHDFDDYGDALAEAALAIRRILKDDESSIEIQEFLP